MSQQPPASCLPHPPSPSPPAAAPSLSRSRQGTCAFADLVHAAAEAAAAAHGVHEEAAGRRYCLAAFLVTDGSPGKHPEVVALGSGTKFLSAELILDNSLHGLRVHDCHAEPLARRALLKWLYRQVHLVLDAEAASGGTVSLAPESPIGGSRSIRNLRWLQRAPSGSGSGAGVGETLSPAFQLVPGAVLHLYCSSCPCGNATLRRWAQAGPAGEASLGTAAAALPPHLWPAEPHPPLSLHAVREGQVQLLVKRDPGSARQGTAAEARDGRGAVSCGRGGMVPPGTLPAGTLPDAPASGPAGAAARPPAVLSCSDKVALWNALGLQGALLYRFLPSRLCPATVTVQRKFSRPHLRRALCCRLAQWGGGAAQRGKSSRGPRAKKGDVGAAAVKSDDGAVAGKSEAETSTAGQEGNGVPAGCCTAAGQYEGVAHPTFLSPTTNRVFDEAGEGDEAGFGAGVSVCWWDGAAEPVRLNGRSGLLWGAEGEGEAAAGPASAAPVCKAALLEEYELLCGRLGLPVLPGGGGVWCEPGGASQGGRKRRMQLAPDTHPQLPDSRPDGAEPGPASPDEGATTATAAATGQLPWPQRYRLSKQQASRQYDVQREQLLSSPLYFAPAEGTHGHPAGAKRRLSTGYCRKASLLSLAQQVEEGPGAERSSTAGGSAAP